MHLDTAPHPVTGLAASAGFRSLARPQCLELLGRSRYGRLTITGGLTPFVTLVRLGRGPATLRLEVSPQVGPLPDCNGIAALEVDRIDPAGSWSVVATGPLTRHGERLTLDLTLASISGRSVTPDHPALPGPVPAMIPAPGVIPPGEAFELLGLQPVGYLAVAADHTPRLFPVNYAMDGDCVVFRTNTGTKLYALSRSLVAFQVDQLTPDGAGWSVVVDGVADELTAAAPEDVCARAASLAIEPWAPGYRPYFVRIIPLRIRGYSHCWAERRAN